MKSLFGAICAAAVFTASADGWKAGEGVANDHAAGKNARDVSFVPRDSSNGYGYRQYALPIGLTFLPWSAPNFESSVYGVRFNFGWGSYAGTYGIDWGVFSRGVEFGGIGANVFGNHFAGDARGIDVGFVNVADGEACGVQIGAVNVAGRLRGLQIGFLNFNRSGIVFPLINFGW
ncbi:MAG: hypothetical protein J6T01_01700 [Kiritimatiellae bacterium]|nr:hypothetical protein [Kiritimatiellia bacterium]